jgi:hypothetical protein
MLKLPVDILKLANLVEQAFQDRLVEICGQTRLPPSSTRMYTRSSWFRTCKAYIGIPKSGRLDRGIRSPGISPGRQALLTAEFKPRGGAT